MCTAGADALDPHLGCPGSLWSLCPDNDAAKGAEAAKAKYSWFEMLALADLLKWCAAGEAEGVRSRLRGVVARLSASKEELAGILGEGAL